MIINYLFESAYIMYMLLLFKTVNTQQEFMKPIFNAMTPYFWVKDVNKDISLNENNTIMYNGQSCNIKSLNVLFRHSARFPSLEWINKMDTVHNLLKNESTILSKVPFIANWTNPFPKRKEYLQSDLGDMEMLQLGDRFSKRFDNHFKEYINYITLTSSSKTRTKTSMKKWHYGLTKSLDERRPNIGVTAVDIVTNDTLIRFYEHCKRYTEEVDRNPSTLKEFYNFLRGKEMMDATENVRKRLGVNVLNSVDVVTMQQICAFELGLFNTSDWCQLFNMNDLLTVDYLIDLRNYWEMGYGYDINWQVSCPYTSRMFRILKTAVER